LIDEEGKYVFGIGVAVDEVVGLLREFGFDMTADVLEAANVAVVCEGELHVGKWVAVGLGGLDAAGCGANVRENGARAGNARQAFEVVVAPRGEERAKEAGLGGDFGNVPGYSKAVAIDRRVDRASVDALVDERVFGLDQELVEDDGFAKVEQEAAHRGEPFS